MTVPGLTLATWIPFLHPINAVLDWWYLLLIPMALGISMTYKALRLADLRKYPQQVIIMTIQVIFAMIALAIVLTVLVQWLIPMLPAE